MSRRFVVFLFVFLLCQHKQTGGADGVREFVQNWIDGCVETTVKAHKKDPSKIQWVSDETNPKKHSYYALLPDTKGIK